MKVSKQLTSLGAAAAALLLSTSIALASTAYAVPQPLATDAAATNVEGRGGPRIPTSPTRPAPVAGPLSDEVVAVMTAGILDEWHAYGVYAAVIDQFGAVRPFTNIRRAEARHADRWATIFARYNVPLPARPVVTDLPEFASLADACAVAAAAETANMDLYDKMLVTLADYPDMVQVATALRAASANNHLPAFERCAETAN